jgi:hypothetical protein
MRTHLALIFSLCFFATLHTAQAQFCNVHIDASTPDSQLVDNGNGTVTDSRTRLMWKKCLEGVSGSYCESGIATAFTWQTALQRPRVINNSSGFAGYRDWRLPNIKELRSIVEEHCYSPAINLTRFPNTPTNMVWSGSPFALEDMVEEASQPIKEFSYVVSFSNGNSSYWFRDHHVGLNVRLVRGGQ